MVDVVARNDIRQDTALSQTVQTLQHIVAVYHPRCIPSHLQRTVRIRIVKHADIPKRHIRTHEVIHPQLIIREVLEAVAIDKRVFGGFPSKFRFQHSRRQDILLESG